jgi:ABC-type transport system involved in multi-copper enzyme maturation permease subunit
MPMLWHKTWLESRARFLIAASALIIVCAVAVGFQVWFRERMTESVTYFAYIYNRPLNLSRVLCQISALVLGLGGLLREREHRTTALTLALPLNRSQVVLARAAVGVVELAVLVLIPGIALPAFSRIAGESYPLSQALQFSLLWLITDGCVFAGTFLLSTVLSGQYTAFLAGWIALFVSGSANAVPRLRPYHFNINHVQSGFDMSYFDPMTMTLQGPLPWLRLGVITCLAVLFLLTAFRITERQDF